MVRLSPARWPKCATEGEGKIAEGFRFYTDEPNMVPRLVDTPGSANIGFSAGPGVSTNAKTTVILICDFITGIIGLNMHAVKFCVSEDIHYTIISSR